MTAEVAVMNKEAVALAADSKVTIGEKTYNTTNKLFALSEEYPVGIMVYGQADIGGIPWETIIKSYRKSCSTEQDSLLDYKDSFFSYIENQSFDFCEEHAIEDICLYVEELSYYIADKIDEFVEDYISKNNSISSEMIRDKASDIINEYYEKTLEFSVFECFPDDFKDELYSEYYEDLHSEALDILERHCDEITAATRNKLVKSAINIFCCLDIQNSSGVVISGFGKNEIFPSLVHCSIEGIYLSKFKMISEEKSIKNDDVSTAGIYSFAQTDIVANFVNGISFEMMDSVSMFFKEVLLQYEKIIFKEVNVAPSEATLSNLQELRGTLSQKLENFIEYEMSKHHSGPLINTVACLPKTELAEMAQDLVALTSFKQKVTLKQESVGGDIDVAVISKTDGFIWIQRKHYFDAKLNPSFMKRYY